MIIPVSRATSRFLSHDSQCTYIVATLLLAAPLSFGAGCKKPKSDRDQIEAVFDAVEAGIEKGELKAVLAHVADGYRDSSGDRDALRGKLFVLGRRGTITVVRNQQDIEINGNAATATVRALAMQGPENAFLPERADEFAFEVTLVKEDAWQITSVKRLSGSTAGPG